VIINSHGSCCNLKTVAVFIFLFCFYLPDNPSIEKSHIGKKNERQSEKTGA
jgi:hypothetical protein